MTTLAITGQADFKAFLAKMKAAKNGAALRRNLTKALRDIGRPVVADVQAAVRSIDVKGVQGRGSVRREGAALARRPRGRAAGFGLRTSVARGAKMSVRLAGKRVGLRIYMDASHLPRSQRDLPRHLDNPKGWRHPVWGHRDRWVRQVGEPYFRRTVARHTPSVRRAVQTAVTDALKELQ